MPAKRAKKEKETPEDYAKWTDENVKARAEFFASMNVEKIAGELKGLSSHAKHKPKQWSDLAEPRRSTRLQQKPPVPLNENEIVSAYESLSYVNDWRHERIFQESLDLEVCGREDHSSTEDIAAFKKVMPHLEGVNELHPIFSGPIKEIQASKVIVSKVCQSRAYSLAMHRSSSPIFYAAGDMDGGIGLHCSTLPNRCEFEPHDKRPVCGLVFDDCHLLSCSYDGTVRSLDLNRTDAKFELIYSADELGLSSLDAPKDGCYKSGDLWVSRFDGCVVRIDNRLRGHNRVAGVYQVNPKFCRTVSTNMEKHLVCTGARDGSISLWDARAMPAENTHGKKPLGIIQHGAAVSGAFLHPTDPYLVLSTSYDDTVRMSRLEGGDCKTLASIRHNNRVGKYLTPFRATWHPTGGLSFVIGSLKHPRCVQLFSASDDSFENRQCSVLFHENFTSVLSLNVFHGSLPLLVGVNSSGRCHEVYLDTVVDLD